jgi:hypothetical protein
MLLLHSNITIRSNQREIAICVDHGNAIYLEYLYTTSCYIYYRQLQPVMSRSRFKLRSK